MDVSRFEQIASCAWRMQRHGRMRVPAVVFASRELLQAMDDKVAEQLANVASLPGIVDAAYAMPDAHWGYGFPIGGVAAFDAGEGGVISAGGVGFDISCGVRTLRTGLRLEDVERAKGRLADLLYARIPAGVGSTGELRLSAEGMNAMLRKGARWAVDEGFGSTEDLEFIEEHGVVAGADPAAVSEQARLRQRDEMGTLGSGNHYLEVQVVDAVFDPVAARAFELATGDVVVSLHCGSRGLGHQIGTDYLREMAIAAPQSGIELVDRELACAPLRSPLGKRYLGAMRAAINCALANRQILTHLTREAFAEFFPGSRLPLLYDVSHNTCKEETHVVAGRGATPVRASQGGDTGLRAGTSGIAAGVSGRRAAGADRRQHGDGIVHSGGGVAGPRRTGFCLGVPRRWPGDKPQCVVEALQRSRRGRGTGGARHRDPQSESARRRRGSAGRLQGCRCGGGSVG